MYIYRHKKIVFNGLPVPATPQREPGVEFDPFDIIFRSKKDFDAWYRSLVAGLATIDEPLNYCKYFVRSNGNDGHYVRDGKSFPVSGLWCGIDGLPDEFISFLKENDFWKDWWKLHERYDGWDKVSVPYWIVQ